MLSGWISNSETVAASYGQNQECDTWQTAALWRLMCSLLWDTLVMLLRSNYHSFLYSLGMQISDQHCYVLEVIGVADGAFIHQEKQHKGWSQRKARNKRHGVTITQWRHQWRRRKSQSQPNSADSQAAGDATRVTSPQTHNFISI